jgi:dihydrolipoamide dehydrogenase
VLAVARRAQGAAEAVTGEIDTAAAVAISGGVTVDQLSHAVPSFPTLGEVWLHLQEAYGL